MMILLVGSAECIPYGYHEMLPQWTEE